MRARWWMVLSCIAATAATGETDSAPSSVTLRFRGPKVGDTWKEESSNKVAVTLSMNGKQIATANETIEHKTLAVLAVNGNAAVRAKIRYSKYLNSTNRGGVASTKPGPVVGKTYTLTSGLPTKIETDNGPVPEGEADLVRDREKRFGTDDRNGKALNGRTFPLGKVVELPAAALALLDQDSTKVTKWTLTYRAMSGPNAVFDTSMRLETDRSGTHIAADLAGKAVIDPQTATVLDMTLDGKITMTGQGTGEGTMALHWRVLR